MKTIGLESGGKADSIRTYRQSVCYPEANSKLLFDVTIEPLPIEQLQEYRLLYTCDHFFINGYAPESFIDKLNVSISQAFYPIDLSIDRKDGAIRINNSQAIIERWEAKKEEVLRENTGEYLLPYINRMDSVLRDASAMHSAFEENIIFINLFAVPFSIDNQVLHQKTNQLRIPLGQYGERLLFNGKFMLGEEDDGESTLLSFDGRAIRYSITPSGSPQVDNYRTKVSYFISREMKTIDDIYADTYLLSEDGEEEKLFQSIRIHYLRS